MCLLNNKSTNDVFLAPFLYVNVESEVVYSMLELMSRSQTPSATHEPIDCIFKVLDGTLVACESGINREPNVVFKVSFSIAIMSPVFSFKS